MEKIPQDIKNKIEQEATFYKDVLIHQVQPVENHFTHGAKFGYSLSQTEIESLKDERDLTNDLLEQYKVWVKERDQTISELQSEVERLGSIINLQSIQIERFKANEERSHDYTDSDFNQ
jgi:hypothetical protein